MKNCIVLCMNEQKSLSRLIQFFVTNMATILFLAFWTNIRQILARMSHSYAETSVIFEIVFSTYIFYQFFPWGTTQAALSNSTYHKQKQSADGTYDFEMVLCSFAAPL